MLTVKWGWRGIKTALTQPNNFYQAKTYGRENEILNRHGLMKKSMRKYTFIFLLGFFFVFTLISIICSSLLPGESVKILRCLFILWNGIDDHEKSVPEILIASSQGTLLSTWKIMSMLLVSFTVKQKMGDCFSSVNH